MQQILQKMSTHRSSNLNYIPECKTLFIELSEDTAFHPNSTRLFPQRMKKLQQPDIFKKQKAIKLIENLASCHFDSDEKVNQKQLSKRFIGETGKLSSYLTYKKEQQLLRMKHDSKMKTYRNKSWHKQSSQSRNRHMGYEMNRTPQKKSNMSTINLVLTPDKQKDRFSCSSRFSPQQRHFYIKTAEGRNHKVTSSQYQNRIKNRLNQTDSQFNSSQIFERFNQHSDRQLLITLNESRNVPRPQTNVASRHLRHLSNKSNGYLWSRQGSLGDSRPWTSSRSQYN